jgi:hypothetical protein
VLVTVLAAACGGEPLEPLDGLPHALATPSCGPADEAIVAIYLAAEPIESLQPAVPFVQVHIPASLSGLRAGQEWHVLDFPTRLTAWLYDDNGTTFRLADRGEVGISEASSSEITGYVDLRFQGGTRIRGRFEADWQPRELLCG